MRPSIPKGTRDFSPADMLKRNYVFDTIRSAFRLYGYLPLETPSMESLGTLLGKYGEEGDKLIFKILNSGNYFSSFQDDKDILETKSKGENVFSSRISEKALRYDLTVPFARYVVMHQHEITFPFKRYQIQPVWRADRPQKGRYREFFQCDADSIGSTSLLCEVDLLQLIDDVFSKLRLNVLVKVNNRKILSGIAGVFGEAGRITDITTAIDKLDKIGIGKVEEELRGKGISGSAIDGLRPLLMFKGDDAAKLELLKSLLKDSATGQEGIREVEQLFEFAGMNSFSHTRYELDITLARGLNYYTGAIFEVKVNDERSSLSSSICGGGRYDDLTGIFGLPGMSGVGISFGADRICDVLDELGLYPDQVSAATKVLVVNFGGDDLPYLFRVLNSLRHAGIASELYPDAVKMKKQLSYADNRGIPFVVIAGTDERSADTVVLKNMKEGSQITLPVEKLPEYLNTQIK